MPNDSNAFQRLSVAEASQLIAAGRGVLVDTRGRHHYDNAHAAGAVSVPLVAIEATEGRAATDAVPPDRVLILYCA
ncbi:MAG TPA: rhodanese-like domain-containing protein [Gemmatimonadales bacterium]|nr:rhodanese-like domain-containing protein [Gemmatimonadales bacterium]